MKKYLLVIIALLTMLCFSSCDEFQGEQTIPSYIKVSGFKLVADPNYVIEQGEDFLTSDITEVWVYVDNIYVGAYSLPKKDALGNPTSELTIPLLYEGKHKLELYPGIKYNGQTSTRDYYRFYTNSNDSINFVPGQVIDMGTKEVMYNNSAVFSFTYFFEDSFAHFVNAPGATIEQPNNFKLITNDSVRYGNTCLAMYSTSSKDDYKIITKDSVVCSHSNAMILEMDYHCNIPFEIGIYGKPSSESKYQYISAMRLKANADKEKPGDSKKGWQKIYIILGKVWSQMSYQPFKIYLQPFNTDNRSDGYVHIDNVKVVHFPE